MSEPFLGELKIISWNYPPRNWAFANGTLLPINQFQALFSVIGTTFGGDGRVNFALPNLQGRTPVHVGNGINLGDRGGEVSHTLNISELPTHSHTMMADKAVGGGTSNTPDPNNSKVLGASSGTTGSPVRPFQANMYSSGTPRATLDPKCVATTGGSQPHENMPPYLVLNIVIALQGIFPSRN